MSDATDRLRASNDALEARQGEPGYMPSLRRSRQDSRESIARLDMVLGKSELRGAILNLLAQIERIEDREFRQDVTLVLGTALEHLR